MTTVAMICHRRTVLSALLRTRTIRDLAPASAKFAIVISLLRARQRGLDMRQRSGEFRNVIHAGDAGCLRVDPSFHIRRSSGQHCFFEPLPLRSFPAARRAPPPAKLHRGHVVRSYETSTQTTNG